LRKGAHKCLGLGGKPQRLKKTPQVSPFFRGMAVPYTRSRRKYNVYDNEFTKKARYCRACGQELINGTCDHEAQVDL